MCLFAKRLERGRQGMRGVGGQESLAGGGTILSVLASRTGHAEGTKTNGTRKSPKISDSISTARHADLCPLAWRT